MKMDNFFKCIIALIFSLNGFIYGSVLNVSSSEFTAGKDDASQNNIFMRPSSAVQQVNCTEVEKCEDSNEIPVACWIQVAGISVSFCLFLVCYIQYRLRVRSKQFKSQILM